MANLLIVDDHESVLNAFQHHFRKIAGWQVDVARDGVEAITLLESKGTWYDGIILDKNMPRASGDIVVKWMYEQELLDEICVVLFTGYPDMGSAVGALRMGVWQYLIKDMGPDQVQKFIAPGIAQKQIHRIRRDIWSEEGLAPVLRRIENVVRDTLAPDGFHVIFLSPSLLRNLSDGSDASPDRIFVEKIRFGARFVTERSKAEVAKLQPVLPDAGTLMAVPVHGTHGLLGVLVMESRQEDAFDSRWKDVLTYFAELLTLAQVMEEQRQVILAREAIKLEELAKANQELNHRITTSLRTIKQSAHDLERALPSDLGRDQVRYITTHADRIEGVLLELRDLSSKHPVQIDTVDVSQIVRRAVQELAPEAEDIPIDISTALEIFGQVDSEELFAVLACLIRNAFDAIVERRTREGDGIKSRVGECTDGGYRIRITLAGTDAGIEIAVTDDGIGFGEETRARLFNPLFSTKTRGAKAKSGYGLYTSQKVLSAMNGSIEPFSRGPYTGATFTIRLKKGRED